MSKIALYKIKVLILVILTQFTQANGQLLPDRTEISGSIAGKVVDSKDNSPVEYATIILFSLLDEKVVTGTVSEKNGSFQLREISMGVYSLEISFVGYKKHKISKILITPKSENIMLGVIKLEESVKSIDEVKVTASKPELTYKIDKKIINVSSDLIAKGGTAADALENVPSVKSDINGNITLRGSGSFKVLIDGRPSVLQGGDALQQIPVESVENIEIITNPSARYDPDGDVGIINVITKKNFKNDLGGMVNASVGTNSKLGGNIALSRRFRKLNTTFVLDASSTPLIFSGNMYRETYMDNHTSIKSFTSDGSILREGISFKSSADFYLNDKNTISLQRVRGGKNMDRDFYSRYTELIMPENRLSYNIDESNSEQTYNYKNWNLSYLHNFDFSEHSLEANIYYSKNSSDYTNLLSDTPSDTVWDPNNDLAYKQRSKEDNSENEFRLNIDYIKPFTSWLKLETGYQYKFTDGLRKYKFENFETAINDWYEIPELRSNLDMNEKIHSYYGMASGEKNSIGYKIGLRVEYFTRNIKMGDTTNKHILKLFDFFPTLHVTYKFVGDMQLQASYSRRINRPGSDRLDPVPVYFDKKNYRIGNPDLNPEYYDSYEVNFLKRVLLSFYSFEVFYRQTNNKISPLRSLNADSSISTTYLNMTKDFSFGTEITGSVMIYEWWRVTVSSSIFRYSIEGGMMGEPVGNSSTSWTAKINSSFKMKWGTQIQLNALYSGDKATTQGTRESFLTTSFAVKQDFFKNSLNLTFQVRDVFNSVRFSAVSRNPYFYSQTEFHPHTPVFLLTCGFRFNKFKNTFKNEEIDKMEMDDLLDEY